MPFVIADPCIDVTDKSCMEECPVDCIYEGARKLYINPFECIDCGACEPACPVEAITEDRHVAEGSEAFVDDSAAFFTIVLPGRDSALGEYPGGAQGVGAVPADTEMVTNFARQE
ncbi:ferredoxin [Actinomycetospora flava]|uniref:Ferredoxin n=1 Tax=Actinomycetospora flava TaxID=3129232 RepID=A0ABU8ME26_9PSEU